MSCASLSAVVVDAPQGMECDASSRSVGPGVKLSEPTSSEVAQGTQAAASRITTFEARTDRHSVSDEGEQLEAALAALGLEDPAAKVEVESALRRAKQGSPVASLDPDTKSSRSDGGFRRSRGREFADSPEASSGGRTGSPVGSPESRQGPFHQEGTEEDCPDR